jgi:hypothetical protein
MLAAAYDFLESTDPFRRWNLPPSEDITFRVMRDPSARGWHTIHKGRDEIAISSTCVKHSHTLIRTMAHEMIHVHERHAKACTSGAHSAAFKRWAEQVCKVHGFDPGCF